MAVVSGYVQVTISVWATSHSRPQDALPRGVPRQASANSKPDPRHCLSRSHAAPSRDTHNEPNDHDTDGCALAGLRTPTWRRDSGCERFTDLSLCILLRRMNSGRSHS